MRPMTWAVAATVATSTMAVPLLAAGIGMTAPPPPAVAGIPPRALAAYQAADNYCPGLRWELVAAIGQVESSHGTSGGAEIDETTGVASPPILGPPLDGRPGIQAIPIGPWLDWWGLTGPWEQAVGPMQFRAPTFTAWAVDAEPDGVTNPNDLDDAAMTAANYLCGPQHEVTDEAGAVRRYNDSAEYLDEVLAIAESYAAAGTIGGPGWLCPVAGPTTFTDTFGAPRPGGRTHQGVDMFAARGTPVVAPVGGRVELRWNAIGGLSFHLWGDDGNYYYGTHLDSYGPSQGHVESGTGLGYIGTSGNAAGTPPHLHFEVRLGDEHLPVNPSGVVEAACEGP
jgi:murein DD-endopeptidase MepM/ murein hydrolase activator NlpD